MKESNEFPGYVAILQRSGESLLDPNKVSDIVKQGEVTETGTGRTLIHYTYCYDYGDLKLTHDVYVPADRDYDFAEELDRAAKERETPGWTDPLRA